MTNYIGSSAYLIRQNQNLSGTGRKFSYSDKIDVNKPALVAFGGALTTTEDKAFGYIEHLSSTIKNKSDIDLYSAVYKFESLDPMLVKAIAFRRAGRKILLDADTNIARHKEHKLDEINEQEPTPGYIEDLYEIVIAPRIIKGDAVKTARNLRNLIIYSHCHGAVVVKQICDITIQQLRNAGFDENTANHCAANVIVIQHNPTAPLENAKFTTLNFMSASDDTLNYFDDFSKKVLKRDNLSPAYMGADYANVFIASKLNNTNGSEHGFSVGYKNDSSALSHNGKIIFSAEQNAINNAIHFATGGATLPTIEDLVSGENVDVAQMRAMGQKIFQEISRD